MIYLLGHERGRKLAAWLGGPEYAAKQARRTAYAALRHAIELRPDLPEPTALTDGSSK